VEEDHGTHLSTGAKIGIGVGAGILGLLIIGFLWGCLAVRHRRRNKMKALQAANTAAGGPIRPESTAYANAVAQADPKHMSAATSAMGSPIMQQHPQSFGSPAQHGFSPAFGYAQVPMQQGYGQPYGIQPVGAGYPGGGMNPYPQSQSPPPPFYPSGATSYDPSQGGFYKPPAEVSGDEVYQQQQYQHPGAHRQSAGMSDTQSQVTSTTAVTGSHSHGQGGEVKPPAELSSTLSMRH
jgi:hypothetical protein